MEVAHNPNTGKVIRATKTEKSCTNIVVLGQQNSGKTSLVSAITKILAKNVSGNKVINYDTIVKPPKISENGITTSRFQAECQTAKRHYNLIDFPSNTDFIKNMLAGSMEIDGAIVVFSYDDISLDVTEQQIWLAKKTGIPHIIGFQNKIEDLIDEEMIELVKMDAEECLEINDFHGCPIICGSALGALRNPNSQWGDTIAQLMNTVDRYIPDSVNKNNQPFLMSVNDVFSITGRGIFVSGKVERGTIHVNDSVELIGLTKEYRNLTVTGITMPKKSLDEATVGDEVDLLFQGVMTNEIQRGQVLAAPGSMRAHTEFEAFVYMLTTTEGGRNTPFYDGYCPQICFHSVNVSGTIELPPKAEMCMPGDHYQMRISLIRSVAMEAGFKFSVREGGRIVGYGCVTEIIE